jgi:hypothetical protein
MILDKFLEFGMDIIIYLRQLVFAFRIPMPMKFLFVFSLPPLIFSKGRNFHLDGIGPILLKLSLFSLTKFLRQYLELALTISRHVFLSLSLDYCVMAQLIIAPLSCSLI